MTTKTEISNLALARIGKPSVLNIDTENSTEAKYSRRFWDIARKAVLRDHDWNFATRRKTLARKDVELDEWEYIYAYPNDCLNVQRIINPIGRKAKPIKYQVLEIAGDLVIGTNQPNAVLEYTTDVTNPALFDSQFIDMMGWRLAVDLSSPLTRDPALMQTCSTWYFEMLRNAKIRDASESEQEGLAEAPWVQAQLGHERTEDYATLNQTE